MKVFNIQLPVVNNDGSDNAEVIQRILADIAGIAGGLTANSAKGLWLDDAGRLVRDEVVNVTTFCDALVLPSLTRLVSVWRVELGQDALVWASWDADVQFVSEGA